MSRTQDMIKRFQVIAGVEDLDGVFWYKDEAHENATLALYFALEEYEEMETQLFVRWIEVNACPRLVILSIFNNAGFENFTSQIK